MGRIFYEGYIQNLTVFHYPLSCHLSVNHHKCLDQCSGLPINIPPFPQMALTLVLQGVWTMLNIVA